MNYEIKQEEKRTVAGFHLVGPWEQTVKSKRAVRTVLTK